MKLRVLLLAASLSVSTIACQGDAGPVGPPGADGQDGTDGTGTDGKDGAGGSSCSVAAGSDGAYTITCGDGTSVTVPAGGGTVAAPLITSFHGTDHLQSTGEFAEGKSFVKATITSASADEAGVVTVGFTVADLSGKPVTTLASVSADVAKLVPPATGERATRWVPYLTRIETATAGDWPMPAGTTAVQGSTDSGGTLTNHGDGSYTYRFGQNISAVVVEGTPVTYERSLVHRVSVMMGGHAGFTADAVFDFVPDGSTPPVATRAIVPTAACKACHGEEFHGHGGNRLSVENCVTCHAPGTSDAQSGESLDFKVMIHKIHAGGELASIPGADGILWDNPATPANEAADNGEYAIWGYRTTKHTWWKVGFPAVLSNCTKCHQGQGADVDNWKTKPSRAACGSCHDNVNFETGENHEGGGPWADAACATCHPSSGTAAWPVSAAHDWTTRDPRNTPEFNASLSVSTPARGYFIAGETPVVTIKLTDAETLQPLDHTTVVEDGAAEGCLVTGCPPRDGLFRSAYLFVNGPRAARKAVLTTSARTQVFSAGAGPWDLSAPGTVLKLLVDNGQDLVKYNKTGGDYVAKAAITVAFPASAFTTPTAATAAEIVALLNGAAAFKDRAIAYVEAGKVGIRSRNLGRVSALQLQASPVTAAVFGDDTSAKVGGGLAVPGVGVYFQSNNVAARTNAALNDPKAVRTQDAITYTLDPVDDLPPGTYVASVEITDRGSVDGTNYKTPTVAKVTFQVKTATEEKPVARNCSTCHQGPDGKGFVLDFLRHYKIFSDDAVDQCGACHDYQNGAVAGASWSGGRPISKRVHAVHFGSSLFTPLATVDYSNGDPVAGRNWDITLPQDIRNCQVCHPDGTSSGTWATQPNRLACMGCHDSDAAKAHIKLQTWDPTPASPWSGDEEESCKACH